MVDKNKKQSKMEVVWSRLFESYEKETDNKIPQQLLMDGVRQISIINDKNSKEKRKIGKITFVTNALTKSTSDMQKYIPFVFWFDRKIFSKLWKDKKHFKDEVK